MSKKVWETVFTYVIPVCFTNTYKFIISNTHIFKYIFIINWRVWLMINLYWEAVFYTIIISNHGNAHAPFQPPSARVCSKNCEMYSQSTFLLHNIWAGSEWDKWAVAGCRECYFVSVQGKLWMSKGFNVAATLTRKTVEWNGCAICSSVMWPLVVWRKFSSV